MAVQTLNNGATYLEQRTKINANDAGIDVLNGEMDAVEGRLDDLEEEVGVYAYLDVSADTVMTDDGEWYRLEGTFSNTILEGFTAGASGITLTADTKKFEVEFNLSGQADKTSRICIGIIKDATFDANGKLTAGTFLDGSRASIQSDVVGSAAGWFSLKALWAGEIVTGETLSLVIQSNVASTTVESFCAAASLHKFF